MEASFQIVSQMLNIPIHLLSRYENMFKMTVEFCEKYRNTFKNNTEWWTFISKLYISVFSPYLERERLLDIPRKIIEPTAENPYVHDHLIMQNPVVLPLFQFQSHDIIVDSRTRDRTKYPNENLFTIPIKTLRNVIMIELVSAIIPQTQYNINIRNNLMVFRETLTGAWLTATIPPGFYSISTLLTTLKTQMQSVGAAIYTISEIIDQSVVRIITDQPVFQINVDESTVTTTIGFTSLSNYTGATTYTGASKYSFTTPTAIKLYVNNYPAVMSTDGTEDFFTLIPMDDAGGDYIYWSMNDKCIAIYHVYKTQSHTIGQLEIKFESYGATDENRNTGIELYDFNGFDVLLHFRFIVGDLRSPNPPA